MCLRTRALPSLQVHRDRTPSSAHSRSQQVDASIPHLRLESHFVMSFLFPLYVFMLDMCKFLRIGDKTNCLNMVCLHINGDHQIGSITGTNDQSRLTIY